jgi:hypothetical protein
VPDAERLGLAHDCDAVLDATWLTRGRIRTLRLALVTDGRSVLLETVPVGDEFLSQSAARRTSDRGAETARSTADGQAAGSRLPGPSPTYSGQTGFRTRRPGGAFPRGTIGGGTGPNDGGTDEPPAPPPGDASGLNGKVRAFALDHLGRKVGDGQCWTLAAEALIHAGARPAEGYTFGEPIPRGQISPGDILQFKRARFDRGGRYWQLGLPDHTAIVEAVQGNVATLLHQNFGSQTVTRLTIDFADQTQGETRAFRPLPR